MLAIDDDWWPWRGFWPYNRAEQKHMNTPELDASWFGNRRDPMDEDQYSEERAFPLLKPSIDVLGVPRRSRTQRGWYQIRSPSRVSPPLPSNVPQVIRTAADLPPELLLRIAELGDYSKHELATYGRVCRHWTDVLQRMLLHFIVITSHSTITRLLHSAPWSKMDVHTEIIELQQRLDSTPFTHLGSYVPQGRRCDQLLLTIYGPLNAKNGTNLRSVYGCVPRTLPSSYSRHFSALQLQDIQFHSVADFVQLVRELRSLRRMDGAQLAWSTGHEELLSTPARRRLSRHCLRLVVLANCTPQHRSSALMLVCTPDIHSAVGEVVRLVDAQLANVASIKSECDTASTPSGYRE